jgi:hypothetical protein
VRLQPISNNNFFAEPPWLTIFHVSCDLFILLFVSLAVHDDGDSVTESPDALEKIPQPC